jgi:hypothetical protein
MSYLRNAILLVVSLFVAGPAMAPAAAAAPAPVVVELFTSQGCSSCPPANATLAVLADRPDVLALSFGVTYWDDLGWKDTFASPQFTARQWDYAHGLHHAQVGTPQMVVQGRRDTVGQSVGEVEPLIEAARRQIDAAPVIAVTDRSVTVAASAGSPRNPTLPSADVWLVRYDPHVVQVPIRRGENGGRTLPHRNVVHQLVKLGDWSGKTETFALPLASVPHLRTAVLLQAGPGGPILSAGVE